MMARVTVSNDIDSHAFLYPGTNQSIDIKGWVLEVAKYNIVGVKYMQGIY
jgi:hypothetical protein